MWLLEINSVGELFGRRAFGQGISERVWINVERLYLHGSVADPLKGNLMIDEVLAELSSVVEGILSAYGRLILVERNSRLELEERGIE